MTTTRTLGIIILCASCALPLAAEETYRLKKSAVVDILIDGKPSGTKLLKTGTVLSLPSTTESEPSVSEPVTGTAKNSTIALNSFFATRPKNGALFKTELSLDSYYNYDYRDQKAVYLSLMIHCYRPDNGDYDSCFGYVKKNSPLGKSIYKLLKDGNRHWAMCKLVPVPNPEDDSVLVESCTSIPPPKDKK